MNVTQAGRSNSSKAMNSVRYMAGLRNVWNTSKLGIRSQPSTEFQQQRFDDGLIEFLGFKNEL